MRTGLISGRDLEGNLFIVDRWGKVDIPLLAARGVRMADLLRAYTFQMEYLWRIAAPEEHEVILLVMDMTGEFPSSLLLLLCVVDPDVHEDHCPFD